MKETPKEQARLEKCAKLGLCVYCERPEKDASERCINRRHEDKK